MSRASRGVALACALALGLSSVGCPEPEPEPGMDAGRDAGPPPDPGTIESVELTEEITLPELDGAVEVVTDERGVPHIYGTTIHDVVYVQGYLMSRDRFGEMEFLRRLVLGTLAEVLGHLDDSLVDQDREMRFEGYGRTGRRLYDSLPDGSLTKLVADAFVAGINQYISEGHRGVLGEEVLNLVLTSPNFAPWEPADIFALARFQAASLSYDGGLDASHSRALAGVRAAFPASSGDPALAARAGIYPELFGDLPARRVYTRDGFPNLDTDTGSRAALPTPGPGLDPPARRPMHLPSIASLDSAVAHYERVQRLFGVLGDEHRGSNSWVVHGDHTASGNPILSNDPHLSLISPAIWWYVHLNTARMGAEGEPAIDAEGVAFAGLPGVVLGYTHDMAWSATTTGYDVTDMYEETIVPGGPLGSVMFNGEAVPIEILTETIRVASSADVVLEIPVVPHHGPLVPGTLTDADAEHALSIRYTGETTSDELAFFLGLLTATNAEEARAAQDNFRVGSQNFSVVTRTGDIAWSTQAYIPTRDPRAMDMVIEADGTITGHCPMFVLPGTGEYEWTGELDARYIPHDQNPARGFIATANQDNVGVTDDGNPCNDPHYIGGGFAYGYRQGRIVERLEGLIERGGITPDDMVALQAETRSSLGETLRDPLVAALARGLEEAATPGTHADLSDAVAGPGGEAMGILQDAHDRLEAWTLQTPHGVGATGATEVADSIATMIFNATLPRLLHLSLDDELSRIGRGTGSSEGARWLEWALTSPEILASYDEASGTSALFDDLETPEAESRDDRILRAVFGAYAFLTEELGADREQWRWGRMHTVTFGAVVPDLSGAGVLNIPQSSSTEYPNGFPRHGDYGAVDVGNFSMWSGTRFTHGSGASQRLVVEMTPDGPIARNALPGGQSRDSNSPHFDDEAMHWIRNEQPPMFFEEPDVVEHAEGRTRFTP